MPVITKRVDKKLPGKGWWSDKERMQAVSAYLIIGNFRLTSAAVGIPEETLRRWKLQPWWKEAEDEIRKSSKIELSGKISNVINKTLLQLEDRVENGDFVYNPKTGKYDRKPINASVASKITGELIGKTLVLEKEVEKERVTDEGLEDRLAKLKEEMLRFAKAKTIQGEYINESARSISEPLQLSEEEAPSATEPNSDSPPRVGYDHHDPEYGALPGSSGSLG